MFHAMCGRASLTTCVPADVQVGQVILTLPYTMAQTGMLLGILLQLAYAVMASWTAYLMNTLYMEHVNRQERAKALSAHPADLNDRSVHAWDSHARLTHKTNFTYAYVMVIVSMASM